MIIIWFENSTNYLINFATYRHWMNDIFQVLCSSKSKPHSNRYQITLILNNFRILHTSLYQGICHNDYNVRQLDPETSRNCI